MRNFVQPGDHVTVAAPAGVLSGDGVEIGNLFGIASTDALSGEDVSIATTGVYDVAKASGEVFAVGDAVSFASGEATTSGLEIGTCVAAAAAGDATVRVLLG